MGWLYLRRGLGAAAACMGLLTVTLGGNGCGLDQVDVTPTGGGVGGAGGSVGQSSVGGAGGSVSQSSVGGSGGSVSQSSVGGAGGSVSQSSVGGVGGAGGSVSQSSVSGVGGSMSQSSVSGVGGAGGGPHVGCPSLLATVPGTHGQPPFVRNTVVASGPAVADSGDIVVGWTGDDPHTPDYGKYAYEIFHYPAQGGAYVARPGGPDDLSVTANGHVASLAVDKTSAHSPTVYTVRRTSLISPFANVSRCSHKVGVRGVPACPEGVYQRVGSDGLGNLYGTVNLYTSADLGGGLVAPGQYLVKIDGSQLASVQPIGSLGLSSLDVTLRGDSAGNVVMSGLGNSCGSSGTAFVAKVDPQGSCAWSKGLSGSVSEPALDVAAKGEMVVAGRFSGTITIDNTVMSAGIGDAFYATKLDSSGNVLWSHSVLNQSQNGATLSEVHMSLRPNGDVVIAARFVGDLDFGQGNANSSSAATNGVIIELDAQTGSLTRMLHAKQLGSIFGVAARGGDVVVLSKSASTDLGCGSLPNVPKAYAYLFSAALSLTF